MTDSNSFETIHILFSRADNKTGAITCQLGDVLSGEVMEEDAPMYTGIGILNLAAAPIPGVSAAEAITIKGTSTDFVIGGRSVRSASIAGLIRMGESCIYADGSQACSLYKNDGSIIHYTTQDNTASGQAVFSKISPDGHEWVTPWTRGIVDSAGWHFSHTSGATLDFGYMGLSGPFAVLGETLGFSTYFSAKAHMMRLDAEILTLGSGALAPSPAVKATELIVLLGTINAAIVALTTAVNAITTATPGAAAATAAQANTLVPAMSAAIAAALETIASRSVLLGS